MGPHFSLCVSHLHPQAWGKKKTLLFPTQYFYSGVALWIKYCATSDPCGFTLFFFLSFSPPTPPVFSSSLGGRRRFLFAHFCLRWDFFPLQGKMASTFFFSFSNFPWLSSVSPLVVSLFTQHVDCRVSPDGPVFQLFLCIFCISFPSML